MFKKLFESDEYQKYLKDYALTPAFLAGDEYVKWLEQKEAVTKDLMDKGGMLKK